MACLLKFLLFRLMGNDRTERKRERKREGERKNEKEQSQLDSKLVFRKSVTFEPAA